MITFGCVIVKMCLRKNLARFAFSDDDRIKLQVTIAFNASFSWQKTSGLRLSRCTNHGWMLKARTMAGRDFTRNQLQSLKDYSSSDWHIGVQAAGTTRSRPPASRRGKNQSSVERDM